MALSWTGPKRWVKRPALIPLCPPHDASQRGPLLAHMTAAPPATSSTPSLFSVPVPTADPPPTLPPGPAPAPRPPEVCSAPAALPASHCSGASTGGRGMSALSQVRSPILSTALYLFHGGVPHVRRGTREHFTRAIHTPGCSMSGTLPRRRAARNPAPSWAPADHQKDTPCVSRPRDSTQSTDQGLGSSEAPPV